MLRYNTYILAVKAKKEHKKICKEERQQRNNQMKMQMRIEIQWIGHKHIDGWYVRGSIEKDA